MLSTSLMPTRSAEIKSRCCSERSKGQLRTIGYSSAEGLSALATVGFSLFTCGWSAPVCVFAGLGAAAVRFGAAYYFNGPSIMEYGSTASVENRSPSYHSGDTIETYEAPRPSCCTNFFSISAQGAFLALDTAQNFADRFFLLTACIKLLGATLSPGAFWGIVLSELAIKQVFNMSNETYETVEKIAQKFDPNAKPFYANALKPISGKNLRRVARILGSVDHALVDDIIKWFPILLETGAASYLVSSGIVARLLLILCSATGFVLGCSLFVLVYYFEGNHTEENLKKLVNDLEKAEPSRFPDIIIDFFKVTMKSTPILHGLGSSTSVYYTLRVIISNSDLNLPMSIVLAGLTFIGTAEGTRCSEMRESIEEIENLRRPPVFTTYDIIYQDR